MRKTFKISGMHCESCAKMIELELEGKVNSIKIDYKTGKAEIDFHETSISEAQIKKIINDLGYKV
jgi:copper chaperone CopZ